MLTANPTPPPRTYHLHRERQRRRILDASEKLFDRHGIDRVTMSDIVSASGLRTSTLYQYFSSKDDIVWAIVEEVLAESTERAKAATKGAGTALDKIIALLNLFADDLVNHQAKVRFMAQFDAMYARDWPADRLLALEAQISPEGFQQLGWLIREGIADGSLRADLQPELTLHAVINAVVGAQRRLASLGSRVELEYGQPIDSLFREITRVILLGLRVT
jgi:TetR/AcrR family transcriptional regulator, cholesterol catabolism regulator